MSQAIKTKSKQKSEEFLGEVENLLASTFKPVSPRQTYIKDLNRRLSHFPTPLPEVVSPRLPRDTFGVIMVVIFGTVLLILGVRALIPMIASITSYYNMRKGMDVFEFGEVSRE